MTLTQKITHCIFLFGTLLLGNFTGFAIDGNGPGDSAGSILVYPYYTSKLNTNWDTRMTIANTDVLNFPGQNVESVKSSFVHMFFIEGKSCLQSDMYICLSPYAAYSFLASEIDPEITGYLIAVAVDSTGNLTNQNSLLGDAFLAEGKYVGNYHAESFRAYGNPGVAKDSIVYFGQRPNGNPLVDSYDYAPSRFSVSLQSPVDAPGQRMVTSGLNGDLNNAVINGAGQIGLGFVFNGSERPSSSFASFHVGSCQAISEITTTLPRVVFTMGKIIPSGQVGTILLPTGPSVGLIMTPQGNNRWSGIRSLQKTRFTKTALKLSSFLPNC